LRFHATQSAEAPFNVGRAVKAAGEDRFGQIGRKALGIKVLETASEEREESAFYGLPIDVQDVAIDVSGEI
jgi:hypothetical protein